MNSPIVGRQAELATAERFLEELADGPAALIIEGVAGIGKTTLWKAIVESAASRPYTTLVSRPVEGEAELSFAGLTDLLGSVVDDLAPRLPEPQREAIEVALLRASSARGAIDMRALGTAVLSCLDELAGRGPVVVAIDDMQWLDAATTRALEFAIRRIRDQPVGFLLSRRPDSARSWPPTSFAGSTVSITVGPLSLAGLHNVVESRFGVSLARPALTRLEQASVGNPLLAIEIVDAVRRSGRPISIDEIPPAPADIARVVADRVAALPAETRDLLVAASAVGRADIETLASVSDARAVSAILQPAIDRDLVHVESGRVHFTHPLYRSAIYASASRAQRRGVHLRLAEQTHDVEEAGRHLAIATHLPDEGAASAVEAAAEHARSRGATDTAAALFEHAARLTPTANRALRGQRRLVLAHVLWEIGEVQRSQVTAEAAMADLPPGHDQAAALLLVAVQALWTDGAEAALAICESALAQALDNPILGAIIHLRMAYVSDERLGLAEAHADTALGLLNLVDSPPDLLACALLMASEIRVLLGKDLSLADVDRGRMLLAAPPNHRVFRVSFDAHAVARERDWLLRAWTDELPAARDTLERLYVDDRAAGRDRSAPITLCDLAELACWLGDLPAARARADAATELAAQTGGTPYGMAAARLAQGIVAFHEGNLARASGEADEALRMAELLGPGAFLDRARVLHGQLALSAGQHRDAVALFSSVSDALQRAGVRLPLVYRFRGDEIEALVLAGELKIARGRIVALEAHARDLPTPWTRAIAERGRGLLAAAEGNVAGGIEHLEEALIHHAALPMPVELGRTLMLIGQLQRRAKAKRMSAATLGRALEIFEGVGARGWAGRASSELARVGLRPPAPDALTSTEEAVAKLAASGMTNRQVADALMMRPKSIDGVLTRVYSKLDIHSRAELGARFAGSPARYKER